MKTIVTHPGGAHKDDFLACSVLLSRHHCLIERRDPTDSDLNDSSIAVVDIGHRHEPALLNFDHHQLPRDHVPTCSLSLVLQHFDLYEDARQFCEWLETAEWFDCRGAIETARWLGVPREAINQLHSPMDVTLLRRFAAHEKLAPGDPLWEVMRMVGEDLIGYLTSMRSQLDWQSKHSQRWEIEGQIFLYIPRVDPLPEDPRGGVGFYLREKGWEKEVVGTIYPDRRGTGYGLSRFEDNQKLDFSRIANESDVHFAHARGFLAKTSATDESRLRELSKAALV
ncbi:MAG: MYG1 family protein [Verrucomicrobiota bacterium]